MLGMSTPPFTNPPSPPRAASSATHDGYYAPGYSSYGPAPAYAGSGYYAPQYAPAPVYGYGYAAPVYPAATIVYSSGPSYRYGHRHYNHRYSGYRSHRGY